MTIGRQGEKEMFRDSTQGLTANSNIDLGQGNVGLQFADMAIGNYNLSL